MFREYTSGFPTYDPEVNSSLDRFCDGPNFHSDAEDEDNPLPSNEGFLSGLHKNYFSPFLNPTSWCLVSWFFKSSHMSLEHLSSLVQDVILADDFNREDLHDFNVQQETKQLDEPSISEPSSSAFQSEGWHTTSVSIRLPCKNIKQSEDSAPEFLVEGLQYRKITDVVKSAFGEPAAETFHTAPYKIYWQPDKTRSPERIITEVYTADVILEEHEAIKNS